MSELLMFLGDASDIIKNAANTACGGAGGSCNTGLDVATLFRNVTNAMIFLIGSFSVIMIIYGGVRYTISRGDKALVESAKNTILYAVVGVVVAIAAYAIVNFVVDAVTKPATPKKTTMVTHELAEALHYGNAYANVTSSKV